MRPLSPRRPFTGRGGTRHLATRLFILYGLLLESAHLLRAGNDTVPELGALLSAGPVFTTFCFRFRFDYREEKPVGVRRRDERTIIAIADAIGSGRFSMLCYCSQPPSAVQTAPIIMMESARAYVAGKSFSGGHKAVAAA